MFSTYFDMGNLNGLFIDSEIQLFTNNELIESHKYSEKPKLYAFNKFMYYSGLIFFVQKKGLN